MGRAYEPSLDGLRAIAVIAVVGYHASIPYFVGGLRGVDVFFVLSGYLITRNLTAGNLSLGEFWRRRAVRLVPALALMIATVLALAQLLIPRYAVTAPRDAAIAASYGMNVALAFRPWDNLFLHTWSLAAEMQFYLIWPLALPRLTRGRPALRLIGLWLALALAQAGMTRLIGPAAYYFPHFSGLALGAAVAFLPSANRYLAIFAAGLVVAGLVNPVVPGHAVEVGTAILISSLREPSQLRGLLEWRPLTRLGLISYGVYLWHFPIHCALEDTFFYIEGPAALVGAIVLASLSYRFVERPLALRWKPATA